MNATVRKAVADKRKELVDKGLALKSQWQEVKDDQARRKTELDALQLAIDDLDAWLTANP
jgi:hypothetical protein